MTIQHRTRVESVDYKTKLVVFICDDCGYKLETQGDRATVLDKGNMHVQHLSQLGVQHAATIATQEKKEPK